MSASFVNWQHGALDGPLVGASRFLPRLAAITTCGLVSSVACHVWDAMISGVPVGGVGWVERREAQRPPRDVDGADGNGMTVVGVAGRGARGSYAANVGLRRLSPTLAGKIGYDDVAIDQLVRNQLNKIYASTDLFERHNLVAIQIKELRWWIDLNPD